MTSFMFLFEEVAEQKRLVINSARNTAMKQIQKTFSIQPVFPCFFLSKSEVVCISFCKTADHPSKLFGYSVSLHSPCQVVLAGSKGFVSEKLDDFMPHIKSIESIHIYLHVFYLIFIIPVYIHRRPGAPRKYINKGPSQNMTSN